MNTYISSAKLLNITHNASTNCQKVDDHQIFEFSSDDSREGQNIGSMVKNYRDSANRRFERNLTRQSPQHRSAMLIKENSNQNKKLPTIKKGGKKGQEEPPRKVRAPITTVEI